MEIDQTTCEADLPQDALEEMMEVIQRDPGIQLDDLVESLTFATADHVLMAVKQGEIFVDLEQHSLSNGAAPVYMTEKQAENYRVIDQTIDPDVSPLPGWVDTSVGARVIWQDETWTIAARSDGTITLECEGGTKTITHDHLINLIDDKKIVSASNGDKQRSALVANRIQQASEKQKRRANIRYWMVRPVLDGEMGSEEAARTWNEDRRFDQPVDDDELPTISGRQLRNYQSAYQEARLQYGVGYEGLIPNSQSKGSGSPLADELQKIIHEVINDVYARRPAPTAKAAYETLVERSDEEGFEPPRLSTFYNYIDKWPDELLERRRKGDVPAQAEAGSSINSPSPFQRHGTRFLQRSHLDTTPVDIFLTDPRTFQPLGQCYLTTLTDAHTRRVLGAHVGYQKPSRQAHMMTLRESVRRFNRLPKSIVFDNSAAAQSVQVQSLLARYRIEQVFRPPYSPQYGGLIENFFGTFQQQLTGRCQGNFTDKDKAEKTRPGNDPALRALWTLQRFNELARYYCYEAFDTRPHDGLRGMTPREAAQKSIREKGWASHRIIPFDQDFIIRTFLSVDQGGTRQASNRGIQVDNLVYRHPDLYEPGIRGTDVEVRKNPADISYVYARIVTKSRDDWVKCLSKEHQRLQGVTDYQREQASRELHEQYSKKASQLPDTALANKIAELEAHLEEEKDEVQKRIRRRQEDAEEAQRKLPDDLDSGPDPGELDSSESDEEESLKPEELPSYDTTTLDPDIA